MTEGVQPGRFFEDLAVGMEAEIARTVTANDIDEFARISGDLNPEHLSEEHAAKTWFGRRIAHGLLTASYISAVFGTRLPGPGCIYISQTLRFKAPVHIGDEVLTIVKITDLIPEKTRANFHCVCRVGHKTVLEGEAVMLVPSRIPKKR